MMSLLLDALCVLLSSKASELSQDWDPATESLSPVV